jgi:predicted transglutaminase-like cysteine proteinase
MTAWKNCTVALLAFLLLVESEAVPAFYVTEKRTASFQREYGEQAVRRLNSLLEMMNSLAATPEDKKIIAVNRFFNQLEYQTDSQTWNCKDYWASRLEFLGKGQGDCEDFAVAKFLTLLQLGVPEDKLYLTYVRAVGYPEAAHLVITYYKIKGSVPFVLDNYDKRVLPATQRKDLIPVYSFTAEDLYLQRQKGLGRNIQRPALKTQRKLKAIEIEIRETN